MHPEYWAFCVFGKIKDFVMIFGVMCKAPG